MKLFIAILSTLLVGLVAGQNDFCSISVEKGCKSSGVLDDFVCDSKFGAISHVESQLQSFANEQLVASYDYLLLSTYFNSYQKDRPGFVKLFRSLSDRAFDNTIKLIKHITKRGSAMDLRYHQEEPKENATPKKTLDLDELQSLARVVDIEKKLSKTAIAAHAHVSKHSSKDHSQYDPEITQFLEEEFLEKQSETIRKLSGYANDLWKIVSADANSTALGVYLFDEYLQKQ